MAIRSMTRKVRCRHLYKARNSDDAATQATELVQSSTVAAFKHIHNSTDEAVAILDELTITGEIQILEEKAKSSLHENLVAIEAKGEA